MKHPVSPDLEIPRNIEPPPSLYVSFQWLILLTACNGKYICSLNISNLSFQPQDPLVLFCSSKNPLEQCRTPVNCCCLPLEYLMLPLHVVQDPGESGLQETGLVSISVTYFQCDLGQDAESLWAPAPSETQPWISFPMNMLVESDQITSWPPLLLSSPHVLSSAIN